MPASSVDGSATTENHRGGVVAAPSPVSAAAPVAGAIAAAALWLVLLIAGPGLGLF